MPKDYFFQPDVPDLTLDQATVLAFARRHAPHARAVTGVDESGGEARTYVIDEALIFKTQRPNRLRPRTSQKRELKRCLDRFRLYPKIVSASVSGMSTANFRIGS
jgi:hygromycin-B 7''-O-kinase